MKLGNRTIRSVARLVLQCLFRGRGMYEEEARATFAKIERKWGKSNPEDVEMFRRYLLPRT